MQSLQFFTTRRSLQVLTAAAVAFVALMPVVVLPLARGAAWQGALPYTESDELAYAAYVCALADGRPRLSDPYTGADERADAPQPESLFSIQFVPAYALAFVVRATHLSVSALFALLGGAAAVASALILFWLIAAITGDARVATLGTLVVLCLGAVPTRYGPFHYLWHYLSGGGRYLFLYLPFLRRYVPAAAFPLYLAFGALVWRALGGTERSRAALLAAACAGFTFAVLVFTYFFLWTAAAAWSASVFVVWLGARPAGWRADLKAFGLMLAPAALSLVPYSLLVARRAASLDATQYLRHTHAPDLLRAPELLALAVLLLLAWAVRRNLLSLRDRAVLFTLACALMPFFVFNQQVLTGRTLQPVHYEMYAANFTALVAFVLACGQLRHALPARLAPRTYARAFVVCALLVFTYAALGAARTATRLSGFFAAQDEMNPVARRLAALGRAHDGVPLETQATIFAPNMTVADTLPSVAPQSVLWALHMFAFPAAGERERFMQFLYYSGVSYEGVSERDVNTLDPARRLYLVMLLGHTRTNLDLDPNWQPIQPAEYGAALRAYNEYAATFSRDRAAHPLLSYLVVAADDPINLANFDRWYTRDAGERIGAFTLYRVRLRP
ncbi:MAG TPA: hypothetical protein VF525_10145 [Pyrinomonadaceae bacterium]|jgi:hypothetical protein